MRKETSIWEGSDLGNVLRSRRRGLGIRQAAGAFSPEIE